MIHIHASQPADIYALEHLHSCTGITPREPIYFAVDTGMSSVPEGALVVWFSATEAPPLRSGAARMLHQPQALLNEVVTTLARVEERGVEVDRHGRMPRASAEAAKRGVAETCFLDRRIQGFAKELENFLRIHGIGFERRSPSARPIIVISHDIDSIKGKSAIRYGFWLAAGLRGGVSGVRAAWRRIHGFRSLRREPHFSFDDFDAFSREFGFRSTYFVLSLPFFLGRERRRYALSTPQLLAALRTARDRGHEIGLHPSRATHLSPEAFRKELDRFGRLLGTDRPPGVRNHYLKAQFPETWRMQETFGIPYDCTLGWAERPGFRAGTSRPFRPFDIERQRTLDVWEVPLVAMDVAMEGLGTAEIVALCGRLAREAFACGNPFTLLWHTDHLSPLDYPEFSPAYRGILEQMRALGCTGMTTSEAVAAYARHEQALAAERVVRRGF